MSRVSCQKGPYSPCWRMADRALWAGYPRYDQVPYCVTCSVIYNRTAWERHSICTTECQPHVTIVHIPYNNQYNMPFQMSYQTVYVYIRTIRWIGRSCLLVFKGTGRADSRLAPSQWETLQSNAVSHWLGATLLDWLNQHWVYGIWINNYTLVTQWDVIIISALVSSKLCLSKMPQLLRI